MLLVCPRCSGSLQPDARACPRCGLVLSTVAEPNTDANVDQMSENGRETYISSYANPEPVAETAPVDYTSPSPVGGGTAPYSPPEPSAYQLPVRPRSRDDQAPLPVPTEAAANASLLVPRGAVEMLPNESVVFQLGALYLTNKRVILLAPSVVRTAFLRDVDAIGTLTERASGWSFFFGLILLGLAGASIYFALFQTDYEASYPLFYVFDPRILAVGFGLLAAYLLANYFFWVKRTLFVSVRGRPLITVSITDWNARKLEGMDSFINAFSQVKDATFAVEQPERQPV